MLSADVAAASISVDPTGTRVDPCSIGVPASMFLYVHLYMRASGKPVKILSSSYYCAELTVLFVPDTTFDEP